MATTGKRPPGRQKTPSGVSVPSASGESAQDRKARRAEAVAAMKREQARRQTRSRLLMASGVVVAVLIVVAAVVVVGLNHKSTAVAAKRQPASSDVITAVSSVPASTFDTIGYGTAQAAPSAIDGGAPLTSDGKPEVLYIGAEYCPFCAAERWALATALARFGTLSGVGETASAPDDNYPNTPTLSFHGATLDSDYLSFKGYEQTTSNRNQALDKVPADAEALQTKYGSGSIPFIYIAGQYASSGAAYDPSLLKGMSHAAIAKALSDPDSTVAKAVDGSANLITAAICQTTGNQPGAVCTSSGVQTAFKAMQAAAKSSSGS